MKILLIEDDQNLCTTIKLRLTKENYVIDACTSGEDGMIYALNPDNGYSVAIIDRMLPVIDGVTILKAMRKKQIFIPVILITGMSELHDRIEGLDSGADDYLVKPFHISELSARIRALTRRPAIISEKSCLQYHDLSLKIVFPFCKQYYVFFYDNIFSAGMRKYRNHAGCGTQRSKQAGHDSCFAF